MKLIYLIVGLICLGLGTVGVLVPLLPTTPFYLVAAFCFARSSVRLHRWFLSTRLYQKHLDSFVRQRAMTRRTKIGVMVSVTLVLTCGFVLMDGLLAGQLVLVTVWLLHILYFSLRIKTLAEPKK